jgi:sn-glycerol 3-phosphate transport system substrate-binding protein
MKTTSLKLFLAGSMSAISLVGVGVAGASVSSKSTPTCAASVATGTKSVINITFWEGMPKGAISGLGNYGALDDLVTAFNKQYAGKIHVTDVNQTGGYTSTWNNYVNALNAHSGVPNVMMFDQYNAQSAADTKSILPVSTCLTNNKVSTKPFTPKVLGAYKFGSSIYGMPFSASVPVMYYNKQALAQAGIKAPPTTMTALLADQKLLQKTTWSDSKGKHTYTSGVSIKYDPWEVTSWLGLDDHSVVNNNNGHTKYATSMTINTPDAKTYLTDLQQIAKNAGGANVYNPSSTSFTQAYGNLFDVASGVSGITFDTTAALGEIQSYLHLYKNVTLGVAPLPTLTGKSTGSMPPGGNGLFINSSASTAAQQSASWVFLNYLTSATVNASWDKSTGYLPIRTDELKPWENSLSSAQKPWYLVGYKSLTGKDDSSTEGPLLGPYSAVNLDISAALQALLTPSFTTSAADALSMATSSGNADISNYNASVH